MLGFPEQVIAFKENFPADNSARWRCNQTKDGQGRGALTAAGLADDAQRLLLVNRKTKFIHGGESAALETELDREVVDLEQRSIHLRFVLARIEDIAQPVADKVKAENRNRNDQPRDNRDVGSELHVAARFAEHQSPAWRRRGKT